MTFLYHHIFYRPLYNALAFLSGIIPGHELGVAIIILTLVVKFILFPFYHKTRRTQHKLKEIQPELKKIKEETAGNKQEEALRTMALYRLHGISPFSGLGLMLIQLPILIALFHVFRGSLEFDPSVLYSFITLPNNVNHLFFGLIDLTQKSYVLAIFAGITQFIQTKLSLPGVPPADRNRDGKVSFSEDLARSMNLQAKYFLPVMIIVFSLGLPGAIPLYWVVGNLFQIGHELIVRRKDEKQKLITTPSLGSKA